MPITIRTNKTGAAKATGKPAVKRTATKATPKATANKRTVKRTASEPAKRATVKRQTASENGGGRNAGLTAAWEKRLVAAGNRLKAAQEEHTAAVQALRELSQEAQGEQITMTAISDLTGVSRQWLYKMPEHGNGNGTKASAKRTTAKAGAKRTTKPAAKASADTGRKRLSIKR